MLADAGYGIDDLDLLVMHQANLRINEAARKALGLPEEKVFNNIQRYGNTTSATLPLCLRRGARGRQGARGGAGRLHRARRRPALGLGAHARLSRAAGSAGAARWPRRRAASRIATPARRAACTACRRGCVGSAGRLLRRVAAAAVCGWRPLLGLEQRVGDGADDGGNQEA